MRTNAAWMLVLAATLSGSPWVVAQTAGAGTTREQVSRDCQAARKAGEIRDGECAPDKPLVKSDSKLTREQVRKDCEAARKAGQVEDGECKPDKASVRDPKAGPRAPVKKDADAARKAGKTTDGEAKSN